MTPPFRYGLSILPLPLREGVGGGVFSRLDPTWMIAKRRQWRVLSSAPSRVDARRPLPLPPSRKGRGRIKSIGRVERLDSEDLASGRGNTLLPCRCPADPPETTA